MSIIRHNSLTTELGGALVGAAQWDDEHEVLGPLSSLPGQYYNTGLAPALGSTLALAANRIYLAPLAVRRPFPIDRLGIQVTTGVAGATVRLALYEGIAENGVNGEAGWPGALLNQSPDMAAATNNALSEFTLSRTLQPSRQYWLGVWASAAITIRAHTVNNAPLLISNGAAATTGIGSMWRDLTYAGGAWPAPWGAVVVSHLTAAQNQNVPAVVWRAA